jgi:signal transduction histidine kinase
MQIKSCLATIILLLFVPFSIWAQDEHRFINTIKDTSKVTLLLKDAKNLRPSSPDSAIATLQEAFRISKDIQYEEGIAGSLLSMAFCYQDKGMYLESKKLLNLAYPHCIIAAEKNKKILPVLLNGLGGTYANLGNNDSALVFFYKALQEAEKLKEQDTLLLARIYNNLGTAWMQKKDLDKGLKYHHKAELLALKIKDTIFLASVYTNIGIASLEKKDTVRAVAYMETALYLYLSKKANHNAAFVYNVLGMAQKSPQQAIPYYQQALNIDSVTAFAAGVYQSMGSAYYLMGRYKDALPYYKKAEQICDEQSLMTHRLANYSALSSIYEKTGDYKNAYWYQVAYANLNDSLLNAEREKTLYQLEIRYRVAEKDKEIAQSKSLVYKLQRSISIAVTATLLIFLIVGIIWQRNRQKQKIQLIQIRNFEQQQKIEHLHSKMQGEEEERSRIARELHDGVNVLLSATKMNYAALGKEFKELPDTNTYREIMQLLNDMGLELRTITYKLVPQLLIQQSLPDAIETFCELIQKGNTLHIELQTYGSFTALPPELCFSIYRIIQELVHNIIKHAKATQVLIALVHQDDLLQLTVEDNGSGFDPEKVSKGLGLKSIRSRVNDIDGKIHFSSQPNVGTSVEIEVVTSSVEVND